MVALSFAFIILVISTLTGTSSLQFIKPAMAAKDKKLITTADIADNAVTSPKIKDGEVKTSDIEDGTITGDDVSPNFMIRKTLNDDAAGNAAGWVPDGILPNFNIKDDDISGVDNSPFVSIMVKDPIGGTDPPVCSVRGTNTAAGFWYVHCDHAPIDGSKLDFIITKLPPNVVTTTASSPSPSTSSSSSSSTPTISSPFSLLGEH